jgi:NDP-hexose-3-ketoreductase
MTAPTILSPVRIGVLGAAKIARRSMLPAIRELPEQFELVAVASRDLSKAQVLAKEFGCEAISGYQSLIERDDVQALYVPLPTGLHPEWVGQAIAAGKHVYVEKSFAPSLAHTQTLLHAAAARGMAVMEGYMFLYHRQQAQVRDWLHEGRIGELRHLHAAFCFPPLPQGDFRYDEVVGGGVLMDAAGYPLRACQMLLGEQVQVVAASLHRRPDGTSVWGSAYLRADDGGLGASISFGFDNHYQCRYELLGSLGKIVAERAYTPAPTFSPRLTLETASTPEHVEVPADNHFVGALREFYKTICDLDRQARHRREILVQSAGLQRIAELAGGRRVYST